MILSVKYEINLILIVLISLFGSAVAQAQMSQQERVQQILAEAQGQTNSLRTTEPDPRVAQIIAEHRAQIKFFEHFMEMQPARCDLAEMKKDRFQNWLAGQGLPHDKLPLKTGVLDVEKVTLVSPLGVRVFTDSGVSLVGWTEFPDDLPSRLGWSQEVNRRYKATRDGNDFVARVHNTAAKEKAVKQANAASADADSRGPLTDPFAEPFKRPFPTDVMAEINLNARLKWPANFDMQLYELNNQTESLSTFNLWRKEGVPGVPVKTSSRILRAAWEKWGCNFNMVVYEVEKQVKAYRGLTE